MPETLADALVLCFSEGVSLRAWEESGVLDREWAMYQSLRPRLGRIVLVTFGGGDDADFLPRLGPDVDLICNHRNLDASAYLAFLTSVAQNTLSGPRIVIKTNQHSAGDAALTFAQGLRQQGRPFALIARGGYPWSRFAARQSSPDDAAAISTAERECRLCRAADLVVGTTQDMLDDLAWRHHLPMHKLALVPNYVPASGQHETPTREPNLILSVGRLVPQKRFDLLIESIALLPTSLRRSILLSIIGQGPLESDLRALASARGVRLSLEHHLPHKEVLARMRRCTLYAQTSAYEGHPKTVIEAMTAAAPIILTDAPGLRGLITPGISGLSTPGTPEAVAAAVTQLLAKPELRASLGAAAAAYASSAFTLDRIAPLEADLYPRALALAAARQEQPIDTAHAVCWPADLLAAPPDRAADAWKHSISAFSQRLAPPARASFLAALDGAIDNLEGHAAAAECA